MFYFSVKSEKKKTMGAPKVLLSRVNEGALLVTECVDKLRTLLSLVLLLAASTTAFPLVLALAAPGYPAVLLAAPLCSSPVCSAVAWVGCTLPGCSLSL